MQLSLLFLVYTASSLIALPFHCCLLGITVTLELLVFSSPHLAHFLNDSTWSSLVMCVQCNQMGSFSFQPSCLLLTLPKFWQCFHFSLPCCAQGETCTSPLYPTQWKHWGLLTSSSICLLLTLQLTKSVQFTAVSISCLCLQHRRELWWSGNGHFLELAHLLREGAAAHRDSLWRVTARGRNPLVSKWASAQHDSVLLELETLQSSQQWVYKLNHILGVMELFLIYTALIAQIQ